MVPSPAPVWLITGASSGFGLTTAEAVLKHGGSVVATLRTPSVLDYLKDQYSSSQLLILQLDVANTQQVASVFEQAIEVFGRVDVVFNNAGIGICAELEAAPDHRNREVMEVNFWGALAVSQCAVQCFRDKNPPGLGGRLIQSSSYSGIQSTPGFGIYCASKAALEAASEALHKELDPAWGIHVTLVEFGRFRTNIYSSSIASGGIFTHPAYKEMASATSNIMRSMNGNLPLQGDPKKAAEAIWKLSQLEAPPLRLALGKDATQVIRQQADQLRQSADNLMDWSEDLDFDE